MANLTFGHFSNARRMLRLGGVAGSDGALTGLTGSRDYACLGSPTNVFARMALPMRSVVGNRRGSALGATAVSFPEVGGMSGGGSCRFDIPSAVLVMRGSDLSTFFRGGGLASGHASCATSCGGGSANIGGTCAFCGVDGLIATVCEGGSGDRG